MDDLLHVKGITTRILELNSQRMTCRRCPGPEGPPRASPTPLGGSEDHRAPAPQVGAEGSLLPRTRTRENIWL